MRKETPGENNIAIVFYQPEIAGNLGTLMRLAACWHMPIHVIEPLGFPWDDRQLKRSSMDYDALALCTRHLTWHDFKNTRPQSRMIALAPKKDPMDENHCYYDFIFHPSDCLILGTESTGLPTSILNTCTSSVHIPMAPGLRSINAALSGAIVWAEALGQNNLFPIA